MDERILKVLVIDDDEDDYILTKMMLERGLAEGVEVSWAASADKARPELESNSVDVALIDYRLGAEDGLALLEEAVQVGFAGPVIMLTGQGDDAVDRRAMTAGASDYLVKGQFDQVQLIRTVLYAVTQKELERSRLATIRQKQQLAAADAASKAKDEVLAMVAHDLRSPLNVISLSFELLEEGNAEERADAIKRGTRSLKRVVALVEDILDAARIGAGKLTVNLEPLDPHGVVASVVQTASAVADELGVELSLASAAGELRIAADQRRLQQIVDNLVSNALKACSKGDKVTVSLSVEENVARLIVEDTGRGIAPEKLEHLFERYFRGHSADSKRDSGLGLGLSIVSHLVKLHGATITAHSEGPGKGTRMTVEFPIVASTA